MEPGSSRTDWAGRSLRQTANPPRHLVLGAFGYDAVVDRLQQRLEEVRSQRDLTLSADFPKA